MKKLILLSSIISLLGIISCDPNRNLAPITEITGQWEAIEFHYNIGAGTDQIKKLDPGLIYTFNPDQSFSINTSAACDKGTFLDEDNILTLNFVCDTVTETAEYRYRIFEEFLTLIRITPPICTEGCSIKYKYIRD